MVDRLANSEANHRRILMVENAFGGGGEPLQHAGRVLVGEGVLTKICRKKPKPRQFFLFNDVLVYGNIVIEKKKYNKQHIMALGDVQLSSLDDEGELKHGWQIISPNKSFAVFAATATEKTEWMAHINKCISDLRKKSGMEGPRAEGAAVWVPDGNTNSCMVCRKSKFSAINRRHHCRKCGSLVCGSCSKNKWLLPHIHNKPVRICAKCYAALRSGTESATDPATKPESGSSAGTESKGDAEGAGKPAEVEAADEPAAEKAENAENAALESSGGSSERPPSGGQGESSEDDLPKPPRDSVLAAAMPGSSDEEEDDDDDDDEAGKDGNEATMAESTEPTFFVENQ